MLTILVKEYLLRVNYKNILLAPLKGQHPVRLRGVVILILSPGF